MFNFFIHIWRSFMTSRPWSYYLFFESQRITQSNFDNWLMPFFVHTKFTSNRHIFYVLYRYPLFLHKQNWLLLQNSTKRFVGMFKAFGNIPNLKKRCPVVFSEKTSSLYSMYLYLITFINNLNEKKSSMYLYLITFINNLNLCSLYFLSVKLTKTK